MSQKIIKIDKQIVSGAPVFYGTRVPVRNLFDYLETGETIEIFLKDFPSVKRKQVIAILEIAKKLLKSATETLNESIA